MKREKREKTDPAFEPNDFELRLFLSVDIAGSTAMKPRLSHHQVFEKHSFAMGVLRRELTPDSTPRDTEATRQLEMLKLALDAALDSEDWASIVENCLQQFHESFISEIDAAKLDSRAYERSPWKAIGDELVYSFGLLDVRHAHGLLTAFLHAIRDQDSQWASRKSIGIRLKATAWVAGFPINNRKVKLPMLQVNGPAQSPWPTIDYLGPDIDIGFRLGKSSWSGMCVISLSLALFLARPADAGDRVELHHMGWEPLKGVWGDRPYPVVWADLPEMRKVGRSTEVVWHSDFPSSRYLENWHRRKKPVSQGTVAAMLVDVCSGLPDALVALPYVPARDGRTQEDAEEYHRAVLQVVQDVRGAALSRKGQAGVARGRATLPPEVSARVEEIERRGAKDPPPGSGSPG